MLNIDNLECALCGRLRDQKQIARAALNAMGFAEEFPFDISDLRGMSDSSRSLLRSFLNWASTQMAFASEPTAYARLLHFAKQDS